MLCYKPADRLSWGLPWGAAGLPGCQIPQRGERSVGVAARWDPDPAVDVLLHPTLLWTCRETAAYNRERGEAWINQICTGEYCLCAFANALARVSPLPAKKLVFHFSSCKRFTDSRTRLEAWENNLITETLVSKHIHTHTDRNILSPPLSQDQNYFLCQIIGSWLNICTKCCPKAMCLFLSVSSKLTSYTDLVFWGLQWSFLLCRWGSLSWSWRSKTPETTWGRPSDSAPTLLLEHLNQSNCSTFPTT